MRPIYISGREESIMKFSTTAVAVPRSHLVRSTNRDNLRDLYFFFVNLFVYNQSIFIIIYKNPVILLYSYIIYSCNSI